MTLVSDYCREMGVRNDQFGGGRTARRPGGAMLYNTTASRVTATPNSRHMQTEENKKDKKKEQEREQNETETADLETNEDEGAAALACECARVFVRSARGVSGLPFRCCTYLRVFSFHLLSTNGMINGREK